MDEVLTYGELFAGIGGMGLGLERAGLECRWRVELDPWRRSVLEHHWPGVPTHDDVRTFPPYGTPRQWKVDVIAGGFPCQDLSYAGKGAGIEGERSGLWLEFARIIGHLQPRYAIVENVPALLDRGMGAVLGTISSLGYDAWYEALPAAAFGASQLRERVFLVAYPSEKRLATHLLASLAEDRDRDASGWRWNEQFERLRGRVGDQAYPPPIGHDEWSRGVQGGWDPPCVERGVRGATYGVPAGLDRIAALGDAICPDAAEWIGRRLIEFHLATES